MLHQVPGEHGAKDNHDSYDGKHRIPNLRIVSGLSGENGDAIPAFIYAFLKRRGRSRHEQLRLVSGPAPSSAHRTGDGELVAPPLYFRSANHFSDPLANQGYF